MLSLLYYIFTLLQLTFFFVLSFLALILLFPFDKSRRVIHELSRAICMTWWYTPFTWRRTITGLEHINKKQPYVIVINHNSMVDILSLYFLPLNFRWVSKKEVFRMPYIGQLLLIHGDIAIDRKRGADSMRRVVEDGKLWVSRGVSIAMFPEGTRSKDGNMHRFKQGAFALAKEAGVAILPVVMDGTTNVLRPNKLFNWRHHLQVSALEPISAEDVASKSVAELSDMAFKAMEARLAEMRENR